MEPAPDAGRNERRQVWTPRLPKGVTPIAFERAILDCIEAITAKRPNPERCKGDATQVVSLWMAAERPPLDEFVGHMRVVAKAARECPHVMFANDIRNEKDGARDGGRSRSVATLCRHGRWPDRKRAAHAWLRTLPGHEPEPEPDAPLPRME